MENKISVVICAKNAEKTIVITLESIIKNNPFEIIVVDGDSKDNTVNVARKYTDRIYSDQNKGLAYARQLGAEKAQGNYIAYIDSDTELPNKNVLSTLYKELCGNNWVAIHTQLVDPRDKKSNELTMTFAIKHNLPIPTNKEKGSSIDIDYSYRATDPFSGTHSIGAKIVF